MSEQEYSSIETEVNIEYIKPIFVRAFQKAFERFSALGADGLETVQTNRFGETALRMDVEAEEVILESFTQDKLPVRVISEEHGVVDIGNPQFLAVLDGIDGTILYKQDRENGKYGTMLGIFQGTNPRYSDYLFGGIMQHTTRKALLGVRGHGAFTIVGDIENSIHTSGARNLSRDNRIYIDKFWEINRNVFEKKLVDFDTVCKMASSLYYADVAEGEADLALECTRKNNLEIAAAYGLIHEAGGVIVDLDGIDIGNKRYLEFGQKEYTPVITAATMELAHSLISFLKKQ